MTEICIGVQTLTCIELKELWLHVIYQCNLSCSHCLFSCSPEKAELGYISFTKCREYIFEAMEHDVKAIYITGGEPLLWPYLPDFLNWYYSMDKVLPLTILTNGTLIDRDQGKYFSKFISQGLNLRISLECYTRENHEKYRGEGSFQRAVQGIKYLNDFGIRPWVAYVNKSGGSVDCSGMLKLEQDFKQRLLENHGLDIAGLKVIAAYSKGRFAGSVSIPVISRQAAEKISKVQCTYGVAVSEDGVFPCPVLVDVPEAKLANSLKDVIGQPFSLIKDVCVSCFTTGTTCGQIS